MFAVKIAAILLIVGGTLGLAWGRFSFTKEEHRASLGPIGVVVQEKQSVAVPVWAGVAAIVGGSLMLMARKRGYAS